MRLFGLIFLNFNSHLFSLVQSSGNVNVSTLYPASLPLFIERVTLKTPCASALDTHTEQKERETVIDGVAVCQFE